MDKIKNYVDAFLKFTERNTPTILTGLGVLGVFETGKMAYKAGPKGKAIMDAKRQDLKDVEPGDHAAKRAVIGEMVKEMAPVVTPPVLMGVATSACIIGSNHVSNRRIAALSAAYTLTETALKDYKEKTKEIIGERKAQQIREAISKDRVKEKSEEIEQHTPPAMLQTTGLVLCMDSFSQRPFYSNAQKIGKAINVISARARSEMSVSINELYDEIGAPELTHLPNGEDFGWTADDALSGCLPIHFTALLTENEQPCLYLEYDARFIADYFRRR